MKKQTIAEKQTEYEKFIQDRLSTIEGALSVGTVQSDRIAHTETAELIHNTKDADIHISIKGDLIDVKKNMDDNKYGKSLVAIKTIQRKFKR